MPTKWGTFEAIGFERDASYNRERVETALALDPRERRDQRVDGEEETGLDREN
jgi:hypothetical protein